MNGTNVGFGPEGREAVSLDLSFAGDPMDVRHVRVAFGGYQMHRFRPAESSRTRIPTVTDGVAALLAEYEQSSLARFHRAFYLTEPNPPASWSRTYDRFDLSALPPCVAAPLVNPHDLLLKPEYIQHVTRFLMSEDWAPRHIAGLVWSRYEKDLGWGERWNLLSARDLTG
jgi:hypothetical protein